MRVLRLAGIIISFVLLGLAFSQDSHAQENTCTPLVVQALQEVSANCGGLGRNVACYGFNRVDATFTQVMAEDFFNQPSDRSELALLTTVQTAPLDMAINQWGVVVMNMQANLPDTLPGQGVIFLLFGDIQLANASTVDANDATPVEVTVATSTSVRSLPVETANVIGRATAGLSVTANARSADGAWIRIFYEFAPAWISRDALAPADGLDALPVVGTEPRAPMQAFYFRTGLGNPTCVGAPPPSLVLQSPQFMTVNLNANGAEILLGSTIVLTQPNAEYIQIIVIDGEVLVEENLLVPTGYTAFAPVDPVTGQVLGPWEGLRPLTPEELAQFMFLEEIDPALLNYRIRVPGSPQTPLPPAPVSPAPPAIPTPASPVDCSAFRPTSPTDGFAYGSNTFYWDPAPGATSYQVNIYDADGGHIASYMALAPDTSLTVDMSDPQFGSGFSFSWEVLALSDGVVACASERVLNMREAPPAPPPPRRADDEGEETPPPLEENPSFIGPVV